MNRRDVIFYRVCRDALAGFCHLVWRLRVEGRERLPEGPFILAPVHRSNIDTPLAGAITTRRMCFLGKDSMWKFRASAWLFNNLGGVPVRRGTSDREALRKCMEVLQRGEPLVIFPEGGRRSGPVVEPLQEGAAYLALRAAVPIVPVGIGGSERAMPKGAKIMRPTRVHIVVGEPILPPPQVGGGRAPRRAVRELNEQLRDEIQRLFDEAQVKAGA
ncbi:MAG TPA: lysophospholipid acyltransferase family protein [Acidimicrobiales bacterium]|nr:lysophospholipid acyltransferase family protein [Acidimicrobiales bacterium]